ncbi:MULTISPECIES: GNAT family N-acetyltransferase [Actinoalloteichus]|uniref:Acetyltransferase, ribosomal protein N-acetylase n=1 Tax=Actinoalloteichus fjordicus TaxID=1612552 RepID=A0AAC9LDS4_9PSEU|nr:MULTISPECIES: GNAT family N-acetyltransferase [Actinoalloteichus]APU15009.1 acetyltransferase, ribosomal protein N-acetylase [Actinoalloteichus fjordicus]APU21077.1 acetyltransferase, ribosomal protein N-acetylase [Actinoalloteichus sp. GBA129-24]
MDIALRDVSDEDAEWYVEQVQDAEILRFTIERASLTVEEFRAALARLRSDDDAMGYLVVDAATGTRLASVAATRQEDGAEVSYWVARAARGRGVARQAVRALCDRVLANWPVNEIRLFTHVDNRASQRTAENAGFHRVDGPDEPREVGGRRWLVRWYRRAR